MVRVLLFLPLFIGCNRIGEKGIDNIKIGRPNVELFLVDETSYDFGTIAFGLTPELEIELEALGTVAAVSLSGSVNSPFEFKDGTYPGTGGTCGITLKSAVCTIVIVFSPSTRGDYSGAFEITYNDQLSDSTLSKTITAKTDTLLTFNESPTYDYSINAIGSTSTNTLTVSHGGGVPATSLSGLSLSSPFSYTGGTFPGTSGSCLSTLTSGTCTIQVDFDPTSVTGYAQTLSLSYNNGIINTQATLNLAGMGVLPAVIVISDGATYDFGQNLITTSVEKTFTVTHTSGGVGATSMAGSGLAAPFQFKDGTFPGTGGTCTDTLGLGQTCTFVAKFSPVSGIVYNDTVLLDYHDGANSQVAQRAVTGTGLTPAYLNISDGPNYNFGNRYLGTSNDKTFTITHTGDVAATSIVGTALSAPFSFKDGNYPGTGGTCGATLSSGTCTIVITYAPTTASGHSASMELTFYSGVSTRTSVRLMSGTGITPADLSISHGPTYFYGAKAIGSSNNKSLTITNSGTTSATGVSGSGLAAPYTFKGGTYPGTGGSCGPSILAGTCSIIVTYSPTTIATHNDTVLIDYNDGLVAQQTNRPLTGSGVAPAVLTISDGPTYNYGSQTTGSNTHATLTVTHSGTASAKSMSGAGLAAPFSFRDGTYPGTGGGCTANLSSGACTIVVTYSPTAVGPHNDTVIVNYNNGASSVQATRPLTGTATLKITVLISNFLRDDPIPTLIGSSSLETFELGELSTQSKSNFAISLPFDFNSNLGKIFVFERPSAIIFETIDRKRNSLFGHTVVTLADLNFDLTKEVIVSAPLDPIGQNRQGSVFLIDGKTGDVLHKFSNPYIGFFGVKLLPWNDFDYDKIKDFYIKSAFGSNRTYYPVSGNTKKLFPPINKTQMKEILWKNLTEQK